MAVRLFCAASRYVQGPGVISQIGDVAARYGKSIAVVTDPFVRDRYGARVAELIDAAGGECHIALLQSDVTQRAIDALAESLRPHEPDIVVGLGGGKALDAAKGVSVALGVPIVTVPTTASNDSPTSVSYALYDDEHIMVGVRQLAQNPVAVLVDSEIVSQAPVPLLLAGIGDAVSKKFEAEACMLGSGSTPLNTRPLTTAGAIADLAYQTLRRDAVAAVADCKAGRLTTALENVIEANILMSGLGYENGGLSLSHSMTRGLVRLRGTKDAVHGMQIAWALLVQLIVEGRDAGFIAELLDFYGRIGLPRRLKDLEIGRAHV